MIREIDAQRCMGFLKVVRTMIDDAEIHLAAATLPGDSTKALNKVRAEVAIASENLVWISEEIVRIAKAQESEQTDGASVDRVSAGRTVVSAEEVGRDQVPES